MTPKKSKDNQKDEFLLLRAVERSNLILLALFTGGGWLLYGWTFAQSVLIGGALSIGSFFWMKRTAIRLIRHVAKQGEKEPRKKGKSFSTSLVLKFYVRLFVVAFLLLLLNTQFSINIIGLVIGLSTVMLSVILIVLLQGRMIFQENM